MYHGLFLCTRCRVLYRTKSLSSSSTWPTDFNILGPCSICWSGSLFWITSDPSSDPNYIQIAVDRSGSAKLRFMSSNLVIRIAKSERHRSWFGWLWLSVTETTEILLVSLCHKDANVFPWRDATRNGYPADLRDLLENWCVRSTRHTHTRTHNSVWTRKLNLTCDQIVSSYWIMRDWLDFIGHNSHTEFCQSAIRQVVVFHSWVTAHISRHSERNTLLGVKKCWKCQV